MICNYFDVLHFENLLKTRGFFHCASSLGLRGYRDPKTNLEMVLRTKMGTPEGMCITLIEKELSFTSRRTLQHLSISPR